MTPTNEGGLPDEVLRLIESSIPTLEAMEIVLLLTRDPGREWHPRMIPQLLQPTVVAEEDVLQYLQVLASHGILDARPENVFVFAPRTPDLAHAIKGFIVAYHQRPVTLIRWVYAGADTKKIRSFADAFRLRKRT